MAEIDVKCVCHECVGEDFLAEIIVHGPVTGACDYCGREEVQVMTLDELVGRVDRVIDDYFVSGQPDPDASVWTEPRGLPLDETIADLLRAPEDLLSEVAEELYQLWFDRSSHENKYGEDPHFMDRESFGSGLSRKWQSMTRSLATESRFMNPEALAVMEQVFADLPALKTTSGNGVIVKAGPGSRIQKLVRARMFQSESSLSDALHHPERFLGAPQPGKGRAGRMNAHGIAMFYGSLDAETAIAEIRPPVGSYVVVATFEIARSLQLLDFPALRSLATVGSKFDTNTIRAFERQEFLATLERMIRRPVMPDHEHQDYLVTQAMADYLANHREVQLDGLMFRSAQGPSAGSWGTNITLFPKASGVENSGDNLGPTAKFRLHEHDDEGFRVAPHIVWLPAKPPMQRSRIADLLTGSDYRREALRLVGNSIEIRRVEAATYSAPAIKTQHTQAPEPTPG